MPGNEAAELTAKETAEEQDQDENQECGSSEGIKTLITAAKRTINEGLQND